MAAPTPTECKLCIQKRVEDGLEPMQLIVLPRRTSKRHLAIKVCPNCDSDLPVRTKGV